LGTKGHGLWKLGEREGRPAIERLTVRGGLSSNVVSALFEDRDGNIWVGTYSGLHKFSRRKSMAITHLGLAASVAADPNGNIWIGTGHGVTRYDSRGQEHPTGLSGLPNTTVFALHVDRRGMLWAATASQIYCLRGNTFRRVEMPETEEL